MEYISSDIRELPPEENRYANPFFLESLSTRFFCGSDKEP